MANRWIWNRSDRKFGHGVRHNQRADFRFHARANRVRANRVRPDGYARPNDTRFDSSSGHSRAGDGQSNSGNGKPDTGNRCPDSWNGSSATGNREPNAGHCHSGHNDA